MSTEATAPASTGSVEATGETVQASSGETILFDELDDILAKGKQSRREKAEAKEKEAKDAPAPKDEPKESKDEKKPTGEPLAAKPKETKEPTKEDPKAEKKEEPKPPEIKTRKYKNGDTEAEIPENALFKVKVNGQDVDVPFAEILQNYSGKVAWDKKFSEVDRKAKDFEQKLGKANQKIENIFKETDPEMRFVKMAELTGKDPVQFREKFLSENMELLEKWYGMSEDERKADSLAFENRILKTRHEAQQKATQEQAHLTELDQRVGKLLESHKIPKEQFIQRYDQVKDMIAQGKFEADKLTPEFVSESIVKDNLWTSAAKAVEPLGVKVDPEKMIKLVELSFSQGLGEIEVAEMAKELWVTDPAKQAIAEKTADRKEVMHGKQPEADQIPKTQTGEGPMFFSEIM